MEAIITMKGEKLTETCVCLNSFGPCVSSPQGQLLSRVFSRDGQADERRVLPVYLVIFVLATVFELALSIDAIANQNILQIVGLNIFQLMMVCYFPLTLYLGSTGLTSEFATQQLLYSIIQISEIKSVRCSSLHDRSSHLKIAGLSGI